MPMSIRLNWQRAAIALALIYLPRDAGVVQAIVCSQWDRSVGLDDYGLFQEGDVVIGGLIPIHNLPPAQDLSFTQPPHLKSCLNFQEGTFKWAHAIVFTVDEINRNPFLLPGVKLGYRILDSCSQHPWSLRGALALVSGGNLSCDSSDLAPLSEATPFHAWPSPVSVVIGDSASTATMIVASTLGPFAVPVRPEVGTPGHPDSVIQDVLSWVQEHFAKKPAQPIDLHVKTSPTIHISPRLFAKPQVGSLVHYLQREREISYQASCACLSDRSQFPNFFRTIPSDVYQARSMAQIVLHFGWTWVGAVVADNDYGLVALQIFQEAIERKGICLAFSKTLNRGNLGRDVKQAVDAIQVSTARLIVVFLWYSDMGALLLELVQRNVTDRQFLASEACSTSTDLLQNPAFLNVARGILGVAIRSAPMPGFEAYLQSLHPFHHPKDVFLKELWEKQFGCTPKAVNTNNQNTSHLPSAVPFTSFPPPQSSTLPPAPSSPYPSLPPCSGEETLRGVHFSFTDTSQLRVTYNVYLAVYAVAHALHSLLSCPIRDTPNWDINSTCSPARELRPVELLHHLNQVNFTTTLNEVFYFTGADIPAVYDLVNWQATPQGFLKLVNIGHVKGSNLLINQSAIQWNTGSNMVPASVCSESCPPGTRVARRKGEPVCCFDCIPCAEGEFSNTIDSLTCKRCPLEFWSNNNRTACIARQLEFFSFNDTMGITLTVVALCGVVATAAVFLLFVCHRHTPLVRANNSELSFLLLLSLKLCFLCSLVFIGHPSVWACRIRQAAFGVIFVLCLSCLLVKTIVVLVAFRSARPGAGQLMRWFGPGQQRGSVFLFTSVQVIICAVWLSISPPLPYHDHGIKGSKVIVECAVGSVAGFTLVLGYIGLLASLCLLFAFLARKLPDKFNEAKLITFSMLIFCAVWVAFVPAYVSSPGKYADAVEIFAILASSFGLLFCIFLPKCFIIMLRPERNTKKHMMVK